jgi:hypothetical protein
MKIWSAILSATLALTLAMAGTAADAKRLGGGSSFGKQSSNVTKREAAPGGANSAAKPAPASRGNAGACRAQEALGRHAGRPGCGPGPGLAGFFAGPGRRFRPDHHVRLAGAGGHGGDRFHHAQAQGRSGLTRKVPRLGRRLLPSRVRATPPPPRTTALKTSATTRPRAPGSAAAWLLMPTNTMRPRLQGWFHDWFGPAGCAVLGCSGRV